MSARGTFRTWRDVLPESAMRAKADISEMNTAACSSRWHSIAGGRWLRQARLREPVSQADRTAPHRQFRISAQFESGTGQTR
jgi:hypothetical protein